MPRVAGFAEHVRALATAEEDDEKPVDKGGPKGARSTPALLPPEALEWEKNEWAKGWGAIDTGARRRRSASTGITISLRRPSSA